MFGMSLPQFLFMAEASGADNLVSTRTAKLNAVVNEIRDNYWGRSIGLDEIEEIARRHNLSTLTDNDIEYIARKIK